MTEPTALEVPGLGSMTFERGVWVGRWAADGLRLRLEIEGSASSTVADLASAIATVQAVDVSAARERVADDLYDLWWRSWSQDGDDDVDRDEFVRRVMPRVVAIHDDGDGHLAFDDGDLFGGHGIALGFRSDGTVRTKAELFG